ncbi:hypothetical protein A3758_16730 [Oleiphilus sp. HI0118]|nr:hypothetical protein A3758_14470 [Oleiphilus sp. HI0118]KZZ51742.1 hypothetical protein A3758_16730 [Oleiphilus sp. HI0118]
MRFLLALIVLFLSVQTQVASSKTFSEVTYETLAVRLCSLYLSSSPNNLVEASKRATTYFIKQNEKRDAEPTIEDAIRLLNQHKHEMTCDGGKHYLNFAIERGYYNEIIDDLFFNELYTEDVKLDFNAITMTLNPTTGLEEPMTVLDYIDKVALYKALSNTRKRELNEIRELILEEFNAKLFSELSPEELAEWEAFKARR